MPIKLLPQKRLQSSDKFFAKGKSKIVQSWFNLEISKVCATFAIQ